jgi:hypothetical protein
MSEIIINRQNILQAIKRSEEVGIRDCDGCFIHHLVTMFRVDMYRPCSYIKKLLNEQHYTHFKDTDGCKYSWISPDTVRLGRVLKI